MQEKKYGLFTTITMITGIVIGSGIFFKSDDILQYTNGNMLLGIAVFLIAAIAIIFGCLTIAQLAGRSDATGGVIGYAEEFVGRKAAGALGWFQVIFYFGTLVPVVAWVSGIYACQLFQIESTLDNQMMIGFVIMTLFFAMNMLSGAVGGYFQNASMIIKLIPLLLFAVIGMIYGKPGAVISHDIESIKSTGVSAGWLTAFAPIAFSYDGWIVAVSIGHKIKNSKRNLPIALIISPLVILACYILYFVGITSLLGTDTVMAQGNDSVFLAATQIFGHIGGKLILIFVIISVLGTLNGLILGFIQL
ncbi:MAG: amino acid permease, partial [Planctomycetia bacterium]|nr:amino acid permease [Planctomycetia bacterium]